ncbi:hypothetical protein DOY81_003034, partial [Sarcophaga bullata]
KLLNFIKQIVITSLRAISKEHQERKKKSKKEIQKEIKIVF